MKVSGFSEDELRGQRHDIVRHPDMPQAVFKDLWDTLQSGESWLGVVKNRCKNGDNYWVDAYVSPIKEKGKITEYQSVCTKVDKEVVARAEAVYKALNEDKTIAALKKPPVSQRTKLFAGFCLALLPVVVTSLINVPVIYTLLVASVFASLAWGLTTWLTRPLYRSRKMAQQIIGNKDYRLAKYVYGGSLNEFATIELALRVAQAERHAIVARVDDAATTVFEASINLVTNTEHATGEIDKLHAQTNMIAVAMNELSATSNEIAKNAQTAADATTRANEETQSSWSIVDCTVSAIKNLAGEVGNAATVIEELEEDSQSIGEVITAIREITDQTNLLALNAAIEAARAGEHGRGFAVVADEVRTLAKKTQESTGEINGIIEKLQARTKNAVGVMQQGRAEAEKSVELAEQVEQSLTAINNSVQTASNMVQQIAMASKEHTIVAEEMNVNITAIKNHADETVAASKRSEGSSMEVANQAMRMQRLAEHFKKIHKTS
ncbi:MAG: methyl-accepting chemotaxis protein [Proteobacteria bacterium]|nr:methyl-accepting chemotaxis protein [Pseudomonadota bacterium]